MQLLSQVFSIKMLYRQLITITLSIYKNFSLGEENKLRDKAFPRRIWAENGISLLNPE